MPQASGATPDTSKPSISSRPNRFSGYRYQVVAAAKAAVRRTVSSRAPDGQRLAPDAHRGGAAHLIGIRFLAVTSVELDPRRIALVLIDLMPRIIAQPMHPISGADVLRQCLTLATAVRRTGGLVVFVRVERPDVDSQPPGSGLAADCEPQPGDVEIVKRTVGAFHNTGLDGVLRSRGIETVVLGGLVTNFGVESTGRVADEHGYSVVFVSDAMAGLHDHAHAFAVEYIFPRFGTVCTSAELRPLSADVVNVERGHARRKTARERCQPLFCLDLR